MINSNYDEISNSESKVNQQILGTCCLDKINQLISENVLYFLLQIGSIYFGLLENQEMQCLLLKVQFCWF